ncbi:MAG: MgtC/SapB family protein [Gammaproteobacteria bacterium]|nr:MAG: MgtC/SapB family protein [Gammaproteobacteria bacterium]
MAVLLNLLLALALGLLIGMERGWHEEQEHGARFAGIRTFGLLGLLGGLWALLAAQLGELLLAVAFAAVAVVILIAHVEAMRIDRDQGITTVIAALLTFGLGALCLRGMRMEAAAMAVVTAFLLDIKPQLHGLLRRMTPQEMRGILKLLLISVVLLPLLPDRNYGPWGALNPYQIWWFVVLIAGISFTGYLAMRLFGSGHGILLTGLLGGLTSSTATTLHFAHLHRRGQDASLLAAGVLVASAIMFPRVLVIVTIVNPDLLPPLVVPLGLMFLAALLAAAWFYLRRPERGDGMAPELGNPFELVPAVKFGLLLTLVILATSALKAWMGSQGVYLAAGVSALADVDAITLSLARLAEQDLPTRVACNGILIASVANTLVKGGFALAVGGGRLGARVLAGFLPTLALGAAAFLFVQAHFFS